MHHSGEGGGHLCARLLPEVSQEQKQQRRQLKDAGEILSQVPTVTSLPHGHGGEPAESHVAGLPPPGGGAQCEEQKARPGGKTEGGGGGV